MKEDDRDNILSTILEVGAFVLAYFTLKDALVYYEIGGEFSKFGPGLLAACGAYSFAVRSYTINRRIKKRWQAEMKRLDKDSF